jgi:hypothetical protein
MRKEDLKENAEKPTDEELVEGESEEAQDPSRMWAPAWFFSFSVHALMALIFWAIVFAVNPEQLELPPMHVTQLDPPPKPPQEKQLPRGLEDKPEINIEGEGDVIAPINNLDLPLDVVTSSEEDNDATMPKGREETVGNSEMGGPGAYMAIGSGPGASGMFGSRTGGGRRRAIAKGSGSRGSEGAVDKALRWFKRHQSPDGRWDIEKHGLNCTEEGPKCEPGSRAKSNGSDADVAATGYALLCFLGAGYDHKIGKYRVVVQKGLDWLKSVQKPDGLLGNRNYEHAVATMALAEAYAMTNNDNDLRGPAQKAVDVIVKRQTKDAKAADAAYNGLGWDYVDPNPARMDASVSGWQIMALKSAMAGGLNVGSSMEGAKKYLERAWKAANPNWQKLTDPYTATSSFPYTWDSTTDKVDVAAPGSNEHDMAPVGALACVFLGRHAGDMMLESLCNHIAKYQFPATYPTNTYYLYYNTLAIFQAGGDRWTKWNNTVRDMLVNSQRKDAGCFDGSWNWADTKFPGFEHGRILSTAYCCLSLEVYYRYKQMGAADAGKK